ncbi:MAG: 4'-phosphopantetheinyl transferase [Gemmatimonadota bacterium]
MGEPFTVVFESRLPHGVCVGVALPEPGGETRAGLERLHPREAAHAWEMPPFRRARWVGGRLALARALAGMGVEDAAVLVAEGGAPDLPPGCVGSVSHKRALAVGLAAPDEGCRVGVDVEERRPVHPRLAQRVLTADERRTLSSAAPGSPAADLLLRFSLKEALYKALHPWVRRRVGFAEVEVEPRPGGQADVRLLLESLEADLVAEAGWHLLAGHLVTTARLSSRDSSSPRARR